MDEQQNADAALHHSATGHALASTAWLDAHFEQSRAIYEAMVADTPLAAGWHVLDAGCGPGSFLPTLASRIGPTGALTALDLDADNLAVAKQRVAANPLICPVTFAEGSVTRLPFPDAAFDAVWCANVSQYLTDDEFRATLAEFRRVVRPGGIVAVKESDGVSAHYDPIDIGLFRRLNLHGLAQGNVQARGVIRAAILRRWLERAGLRDVWQRTYLEERWAPLSDDERQGAGAFLRYLAAAAEQTAIPEEDRAFWRAQRDPAHPDALVNHPEFYHRGGYTLAVGVNAE
ncbi:MAG TPA: methyltransferase domain-containing protein [Thermomicrobiaceae bacterium]|nr:methyltransferase domain-containing protein [Thermomicrobiaceae bacterium]